MTSLEIVLLICGIICIVVSFIISDKKDINEERQIISTELTEKQKQDIKNQINQVVSDEVEALSERTEVTLDKISNTKIMEMNEYAETILGEINRNHNETVFLYDMLNEKAKEVKSTVKDVNITKRQVQRIQAEVSTTDENASTQEKFEEDTEDSLAKAVEHITAVENQKTAEMNEKKNNQTAKGSKSIKSTTAKETTDTKKTVTTKKVTENQDKAKSDVKTARKPRVKKTDVVGQPADEVVEMNIQFEKGANNNDRILKLYSESKSNKEIAKELGLGIGEVKLVIDLYNSGK